LQLRFYTHNHATDNSQLYLQKDLPPWGHNSSHGAKDLDSLFSMDATWPLHINSTNKGQS
jgi:hypothetical protein